MWNLHLYKIMSLSNHFFMSIRWIIFFLTGLCLPVINANTPKQLHCLGNGNYCAFGQGADIESIFGPGYSSPSYLQLTVNGSDSTVSSRMKGTAIWQHSIYKDGKIIVELTDFIDSKTAVFARTIHCYTEFFVDINILEDEKIIIAENFYANKKEKSSSLVIYKDRGLPIYGNYAHPYEQFQHILTKGSATLIKKKSFNYSLHIRPGKSEIFLIGGSTFQECEEHTNLVINNSIDSFFNRTKEYWFEYTKRRYDFEQLIPDHLPNKKEIIDQIDNVAVILKTQQAEQGSVIAGHRYHLGYVRDQYGVSRGFLAMGYFEEARKILDLYWDIWKDFGYIRNAQAIGIPGIFHQHENDEVEITGYLIIQAFDYLKKTNDTTFVKEIFPMLEWAWQVQKNNLKKGMLPFNGDETYVAGGILPRSALNDGSAEATLLFIESGNDLLPFIDENRLWDAAAIESNRAVIDSTKTAFHYNFISDNQIMANLDTYLRSIRICHNITRQYDENSEVMGSFTHSWVETVELYSAKEMLTAMQQFSSLEGDFQWGVAYHPYPQDLNEPKTWNDGKATFSINSPLVTFKNLEVIDHWVKQPENRYKGSLKRTLWLSENGTNSRTYKSKDLMEQAAGFAYAWKKLSRLEGIDAIQWHNWIDNRSEFGLRIGLRRFPDDSTDPGGPKPVWHAYKAAGTENEDAVFDQYKPVIGINDWNEIMQIIN